MVIRTLVSLAVLFCGLSAQAEFITQIPGAFTPVTYGTPPNDGTIGISQNDLGATAPNLTSFAIIYDDFTFSTTGVANNVQWVGAYEDLSTTPQAPNFKVSFYADNANAPGAVIATYNVGSANETSLGGANAAYFSYTAAIPNFAVTSGTKYWLSVAADLDYGTNGWGVAYTNLGNGSSVQDFGDLALTRFTDPIGYALAANVSAVPEPSTGLLALAAASGLGFFRKREKMAGGLAFFRRIVKLG